jgi:hypothetical protein
LGVYQEQDLTWVLIFGNRIIIDEILGCVTWVALPFTLKSILRQKEEL